MHKGVYFLSILTPSRSILDFPHLKHSSHLVRVQFSQLYLLQISGYIQDGRFVIFLIVLSFYIIPFFDANFDLLTS